MATQVQFRGGTTTEHASFNGVAKEVTVDTTKNTLVVQDGSTNGGFPLLKENGTASIITTGDIKIDSDTTKLYLGADYELQVFHNGTDSIIKDTRNAGSIKVQADLFQVIDKDAGQTLFSAAVSGPTKLFYGGATDPKLSTQSYGVQLLDAVVFDNPDNAGKDINWAPDINTLRFSDSVKGTFGASDDLQIFHNGTRSKIQNNTGELRLCSNTIELKNYDDDETFLTATDDGAVQIYNDNILHFTTHSLGIKVLGADGGTAQIDIQPDQGADNADKWKVGAEDNGHFFISNKDSGAWDKSIAANRSGNVELYWDGAQKAATIDQGLQVQHTASETQLKLYRYDNVPANNPVGRIYFIGKQWSGDGTNASDKTYCFIETKATDTTPDSVDSELNFFTKTNGADKSITFSNGGATFTGTIYCSSGTNISPNSSGDGHIRANFAGYTGYFTGDGTAMYLGHNSGSRNLVLQTNYTNALTIDTSQNTTLAGSLNAKYLNGTQGGNTASQKLRLSGSGNSTGDDLTINNWGDVEGDYWSIGVNSTSNAGGSSAKTNTDKRSVSVTLDGRMGRVLLETSQTSTATRDTTHQWDRSGDYTLTGNINVAAGKGINFGANSDGSRSVSTGGNVLDEYEEGTFTPQLGGATNHGTHEISGGATYTKIGRKVYMQIAFQSSDLNNSAAGQVLIKNLPFTFVDTTVNSSHTSAGISCDFATTNVTMPDSGDMNRYVWQLIGSAGQIKGYIATDGGGMTDWDAGSFTAYAMELRLNITGLTAT